jgi:D-sedoheptulose 7-phosphate isomerase
MSDLVRRRMELHAAMVADLLAGDAAEQAAALAGAIVESYRQGGKVILFGNGGSSADAQHVAGELTGRYLLERAPLPAIALADNTAGLTAIGNDYGYPEVFARQMRAFGRPGDVALGLSTSGGSANVLAGLRAARDLGLVTAGITGAGAGRMPDVCDHCIRVPSDETPQVQEGTMLVLHTICELVEHDLFGG